MINQYHELGDCCLVKRPYQYYSNEFKVDIVKQVLEKCLSCEQVALRYGVGISTLELWVRKVKQDGYDSLIADHPRGRPPKEMGRPKKKEQQTELEILREQNERLKTEIALLKKVRALVEAREARLSEIGQKPSKD